MQRPPADRRELQEIILRELDDVDEEYVDDEAGESTQEDAPPAQGDDQVILCGLYWDSNKRLDLPEEFVKLLEYAQGKDIPVLICGDFNAHSEVWGSHKPNARGRIMEEVMITHDLCVLNEGDRPTFKHENTKGTIIDVCLASSVLMKRFDGWKVSNYATASDHRRIDFKFCKNEQNIRIGRNLKKANWLLFQGEVSTYLANVPDIPEKWDTNTIDGQVDLLESAIIQGLDKVAPLKPRRLRDRSPINDPRVIEAEKEFHRMRGRVKRKGRTVELLEQFRNAKRNKKKAWKDATRNGYRGYVNEIADAKGAAQLMRSVKRDSFVPPTLLKNNGKYTSTKRETIEVLMDTHFPGSLQAQPELASQMEEIVRGDNAAKKLSPIKWIDEEKVRKAIKSFSDFKANGPDGIKPIILKRLPDEAIKRLVQIYTACITLGYTPLKWRASRTVFIPKPGKEDYTIPKSFRPISLTSFCFKTLERLVLWHLERTTFRRQPMHQKQHAFRKGHSTEVALSQVTDRIEKAILNNKLAMAAFLDIEGAFDNLDTAAAVKSMRSHGLDKNIIQWYEHYLKNRMSSVEYGEKTSHRALTKGTPQGGVLSPILWNLAFDSLLQKFDKGTVEIFGYADDACLITTAHDPKIARKRMQDAVNKCTAWGDKQGLRFSPKKTVIIFFRRRKNNIDPGGKIKMNGQEVEYSESARYLGVYMDSELRWKEHF